jgi:hypothetical protein
MRRGSIILVEILLAAIFLTLSIPYIPSLCYRIAGPVPGMWVSIIESNRQSLQLAELKRQLAALEAGRRAQLEASARSKRVVQQIEDAAAHRQAETLKPAFSDRQNALYEKCVAPKMAQRGRDELIRRIWMSEPYVTECAAIPQG